MFVKSVRSSLKPRGLEKKIIVLVMPTTGDLTKTQELSLSRECACPVRKIGEIMLEAARDAKPAGEGRLRVKGKEVVDAPVSMRAAARGREFTSKVS